jgi:Family of unknown function (DUF6521)
MQISFGNSPPEEAALFNPAFMGLLIAISAKDYEATCKTPMPFALAFLIPPMALDAETRDQLPGNVNALLSPWLLAHPLIQAGFAERATAMVPLVREGLRYAMRSGSLRLTGDALHSGIANRVKTDLGTQDARDCAKAAALAARWFARTGDIATVFALLGVRP